MEGSDMLIELVLKRCGSMLEKYQCLPYKYSSEDQGHCYVGYKHSCQQQSQNEHMGPWLTHPRTSFEAELLRRLGLEGMDWLIDRTFLRSELLAAGKVRSSKHLDHSFDWLVGIQAEHTVQKSDSKIERIEMHHHEHFRRLQCQTDQECPRDV
jgi:hypothetical protein